MNNKNFSEKEANSMNDFSSITVTRRGKEEELVVNNPTSYPLIGKGIQGAVFKLTEDRCVKIFLKPKNVKKEKEAMIKGQGLPFMPKFFESGPNYIIMEYIDGPSLRDYLKEQGTISESITQQLVSMKKEMKRLGFTNLDRCVIRHIFVDNQQVLKVVDHANSYDWKPIPVRLLDSLSELGLIDPFLQQVKVLDSELYSEWKNFLSKPRK
ncbi:serine/threonine protein kinase [Peribacillus sp. B2I2]|uniref:serine/threonine protein kinase n=1 Tax=Peribacillus sp. B2I2 TaxID=3156468 RepID=UPI003514D2A9